MAQESAVEKGNHSLCPLGRSELEKGEGGKEVAGGGRSVVRKINLLGLWQRKKLARSKLQGIFPDG